MSTGRPSRPRPASTTATAPTLSAAPILSAAPVLSSAPIVHAPASSLSSASFSSLPTRPTYRSRPDLNNGYNQSNKQASPFPDYGIGRAPSTHRYQSRPLSNQQQQFPISSSSSSSSSSASSVPYANMTTASSIGAAGTSTVLASAPMLLPPQTTNPSSQEILPATSQRSSVHPGPAPGTAATYRPFSNALRQSNHLAANTSYPYSPSYPQTNLFPSNGSSSFPSQTTPTIKMLGAKSSAAATQPLYSSPASSYEGGLNYTQAGLQEAITEKRAKASKEGKILRVAGGEVWEDETLNEWEKGTTNTFLIIIVLVFN